MGIALWVPRSSLTSRGLDNAIVALAGVCFIIYVSMGCYGIQQYIIHRHFWYIKMSKITSHYIFVLCNCNSSPSVWNLCVSACFNVQHIVFSVCVHSAGLFPAFGAVRCQGIAQQVGKGARQSLRHFNPKRLGCYL